MDETLRVDMTDIDFSKIEKYMVIDSKVILDLLKQLNTVINVKASKLYRGITFKVWDNSTVFAICPNELYFFKAELNCTTTFAPDTCIYIEFNTLQKLSRFFENDFYIFQLNDKYYLKLATSNLELLSPELLEDDKKKLVDRYELKDTHYTYRVGDITNKLKSLYSITDFELEANKRWINSRDGIVTFKSALLMAKSDFDFINAKIDYKVLNYILYLCSIALPDSHIEIWEVNSPIIPKFAICYENTIMVSSYPRSSDALKVINLFNDLPKFTVIDYSDLKYKLEYADSITYAKGVVTFINRDDKLIGKIKLNNNSETEVEIPVLGEMCLKRSEQIKVNFKTLLIALNSLNPELETYFGLKDGLLYLINSDISLAMITF